MNPLWIWLITEDPLGIETYKFGTRYVSSLIYQKDYEGPFRMRGLMPDGRFVPKMYEHNQAAFFLAPLEYPSCLEVIDEP